MCKEVWFKSRRCMCLYDNEIKLFFILVCYLYGSYLFL